MAWSITEHFHKPIALLGWIVFLAKPIWRLIEFLDDIDFVADLFGSGDRITQGWVSAAIEFLDTGWGTDLPPRTSPPSKLDSEPFAVHSTG